ncbi:hypothetical protein EK21DRAFT_70610, partial [Setomelanomma holmii]
SARGTITLLIECILTMLICTWSALHLNVPQPGLSSTAIFLIKAPYFILALIAPGYFVACAIREWINARDLTRTMQRHSPVGKIFLLKRNR